MAYLYMLICFFDFIVFPSLYMWFQSQSEVIGDAGFTQWAPITLSNGGFFHIAMGAIIGVYAYQRSREKIEGVADDYESTSEEFTPTGN